MSLVTVAENLIDKISFARQVYKYLPLMAAEGLDQARVNEVESLFNRLKNAKDQAEELKNELVNIKTELEVLSGSEIFRQYLNRVWEPPTSRSTSSTSFEEPTPKRNKFDFTEDGEYVVVYTDGACENNGTPNAKAGYGVWWAENHPLNAAKPVRGKATNNVAEIQACIYAVRIASKYEVKKLKIITDSQFVINAMTKWLPNWKTNNWKLSGSNKEVKNKADFQDLDKWSENLEIEWVHVAAHSGIQGNEEADKLAKQGARWYIPQD